MTLADLVDVLPIQREGSVLTLSNVFPQDRYPFPDGAVYDRWVEEIAHPEVACFVVMDGHRQVAGFAAAQGPEFLHFGTAVHTWGTGVASTAHEEVLAHIRASGHDRAWLRVFAGNARARRFYERRGWRLTGEQARSTFPPHPTLLQYAVAIPRLSA
jgi:RimJ/RimL family protein N-acetyltransferase